MKRTPNFATYAIEPSGRDYPPCSWCGLRVGSETLYATPTCPECADGDRTDRIRAYAKRLRREAAE